MNERIKEVNNADNGTTDVSPSPAITANVTKKLKIFHGIRNGISQMAIMFKAPYLKNACVVFFIQFCILFG